MINRELGHFEKKNIVSACARSSCCSPCSNRGSRGRTSSYYSIDVSASYNIDIGDEQKLVVRADIFNLLNNDRVTEVNEIYDDESSADPTNPDVNPNYGLPTAWQTPRYVRFSVNYSF